MPLGISVTDLEIEEAIREAWVVLSAGSAASPSARRLAAALLAMTGGTQAHPHWVTPDDLWRDRLAVLADQGAWLASWGPRPGSRAAGRPLPCCRKARRGARTPMPCGVRPRGPAPMLTARAKPHESRERIAGITPNRLALPAPRPDGANRPYPMACRIKQQRRRACLTTRPVLSQAGGFDPVDAEAAALITASARHWTSRATCLSDSRSLSARLPSRKIWRNTPCPSLLPYPHFT
jgi:hypothetical protein